MNIDPDADGSPARSGLDRRRFLTAGALGFAALALRPRLLCAAPAPFGSGIAERAADGSILVVVELGGGNDGLNMVVPFGDDAYHAARPTLRLDGKACHRLTDVLGLHPRLRGMKELYDGGHLAIVQAVGYPNPNRSHFKSMDIWHSADPGSSAKRSGWLGRLADACCAERPEPQFTINLAGKPPLALQGSVSQPISFQNPNAYRFVGSGSEMRAFERLTDDAGADHDEVLALLGKTAESARESSDGIRKAVAAYRTPVQYAGGGLGQSLRTVAALIDAKLPTRVYYAYHNGFDTHTNQAPRHEQLLLQLDQALSAFQKDLDRQQSAPRVVTLVFSEFGRRVRENGSRGTDHGTAGPVFVLGGPVAGGLYGRTPSLTKLDRGDLVFDVDFRRVYATLLQDHMRVPPATVLGEKFEKLPLIG